MKPARLPLPPQIHRGCRASGPRPGAGSRPWPARDGDTPPIKHQPQSKEIDMNETPCPGHVVQCGSCKGSGRDPVLPLSQKCDVCKGVGSVLLQARP